MLPSWLFSAPKRPLILPTLAGVIYRQQDGLGSSVLVTRTDGQLIERAVYAPYGGLVQPSAGAGKNAPEFGFTGQRFEKGIGVYDYAARWYDPVMGRFLSADSIVPGNGLVPQALNRYSYVLNSTTNLTDPTGHEPKVVSTSRPDWLQPGFVFVTYEEGAKRWTNVVQIGGGGAQNPTLTSKDIGGGRSVSGDPISISAWQFATLAVTSSLISFNDALSNAGSDRASPSLFSGPGLQNGRPVPGSVKPHSDGSGGADDAVDLTIKLGSIGVRLWPDAQLDKQIHQMQIWARQDDLFQNEDAYVYKEFLYTKGYNGMEMFAGGRITDIRTVPIGYPPGSRKGWEDRNFRYDYSLPILISPVRLDLRNGDAGLPWWRR